MSQLCVNEKVVWHFSAAVSVFISSECVPSSKCQTWQEKTLIWWRCFSICCQRDSSVMSPLQQSSRLTTLSLCQWVSTHGTHSLPILSNSYLSFYIENINLFQRPHNFNSNFVYTLLSEVHFKSTVYTAITWNAKK